MDAKQDVSSQVAMLSEQVAELNQQLAYMVKKQEERDELLAEMQPILKAGMDHATGRLQEYEERGYFTFMKESLHVLDRIVESYDEEDVRLLGDNIVRIMDTVRAYTQPQVLALANEATEVIDNADELEPTGIFGMVRASRDEDVQKGMAVFLGILRSVGRGVKAAQQEPAVKPRKRPKLRAVPAPAPEPRAARHAPAAAPAPAPGPVMIDGVAFDANGYLADPQQWTKPLAVALAASLGVGELTEAHWHALETARADFLESGMAPNIRRLTKLAGITTKDLYQLFPKAPGMTVARIAGISKPAGCI